MRSTMWILHTLSLLIILFVIDDIQGKHKGFVYKISTFIDCDYEGYKPAADARHISDIKTPEVEMAKDGLSQVLAGLSAASKLDAEALKLIAKYSTTVAAVQPELGAALMILGVATKTISDLFKPKLSDLTDKVNNAFKELAEEMNKAIDHLEGYVDTKVMLSEKELIGREYRASHRFWTACIQQTTPELVQECQRDAIAHLIAIRPKFAIFDDLLRTGTTLTSDQYHKLEAYLQPFRDYANLVIMELSPLIDSLCDDKKKTYNKDMCIQYATDLQRETAFFKDYAWLAVGAIQAGHRGVDDIGVCGSTTRIGGKHKVKEGGKHTVDWYECNCVVEDSNIKQICSIRVNVRKDGKRPGGYSETGDWKWNDSQYVNWACNYRLTVISSEYQHANAPIVKEYWQRKIIDFIGEWDLAWKKAKTALVGKSPIDPAIAHILNIKKFSARYEKRLKKAGHYD